MTSQTEGTLPQQGRHRFANVDFKRVLVELEIFDSGPEPDIGSWSLVKPSEFYIAAFFDCSKLHLCRFFSHNLQRMCPWVRKSRPFVSKVY